jgi:hypothetical protein
MLCGFVLRREEVYSAAICIICAWLIVRKMDYVFCNMFHSRALNYIANQQH